MRDTTRAKIIETRDLARIYGDGQQVRALDGVSLTIYEGELLAIMGPSGSGKSTLLHMLGALERPTSGQVLIDGQDLAQVRRLDQFRSQTVGFVFQLHNLIPSLTAVENVEVPLGESALRGAERRRWATELLGLVGLSDRAAHLPNQLSGGQRQKVAIARALANKPRLILADEPTGNLDSVSGAEIMDLFGRLNRERAATIIIVTHDPAVARATRRRVILRDGKVIGDHPIVDGATEDLREFARSALGRQIAAGDLSALERLGLARDGRLALEDLSRLLATL
jgi:ABC-type lipoprotein export system ATPase subunit